MTPLDNQRRKDDTNFYFITPVWGEAYTRLFLDISIPSQLSAGNLESFRGDPGHRYVICTKAVDVATIRAAPSFQKLAEMIQPEIVVVDETRDAIHDLMSECYRRGIALADAAQSAVVLLTPDIIFSDGAFTSIRKIAARGHDAIFIPGLRTLKQGVVFAMQDWKNADGVISIPPQDLMRVALDNLHPLAETAWWDEGECDLMPSTLHWRVADEGIVARCFHLHPIMVRPQVPGASFYGTVDDDYVSAACPDASRDYVVEDSDEVLCIELSDPRRFFKTGANKGSVKDAARWAEQCTTQRHRQLFRATVKMHARIANPALWNAAIARAESVAQQVTSRMDRPTWQLLSSFDKALVPRLIRRVQDHRLQRSLHKANTVHRNPTGLVASVMDVAVWGLETYRKVAPWARDLEKRIDCAVFGPLERPAIWLPGYSHRRAMVREIRGLLQNRTQCIVLCRDQDTSVVARIAAETGCDIRYATLSFRAGELRIVASDGGASIADASCDLLVIDHALPTVDKLAVISAELARVAAPGGEVALLIDATANPNELGANETAMSADAVASLIMPAFITTRRTTFGSVGSVLVSIWSSWLSLQLARVGLPRPLSFALFPLFVPLRAIGGLIASIFALLFDRIDATNRFYVSSLVVGTKTGQDAPVR